MSDELAHLRQQVQTLQHENERLRAALTQQQSAAASPEERQPDPQIDYQAVYRQLPVSVIIYQLDGLLVDGNKHAEVVFQVPREVAIGTYNVLQNPENIELGVPDYFARAASGEVVRMPAVLYTNQYVENRTSDHPIWVQTTFAPLRAATGEVQYVAAIELDVTEQKAAETARDQLQAQVLDTQERIIRELSAPLIPLAEHILAMPLVGQMTRQRVQQVMEVLLEGITAYQAEQVILDLTGVSALDNQVAQELLQLARAVQLLGSQLILTGINAFLAQTLVQLDANLEGIRTFSTLQDGITYTLRE